jgi:N-acetylneuraminate synthase
LDKYRESPWGTTNREQKNGLEFSEKEYDEIDAYCKEKGIHWLASAWDVNSQIFLRKYDLKYNKVASAMLTVKPLIEAIAEERKYTFVSTGMSTMEEISNAIEIFKKVDCPFELMHTVSTYPMRDNDANLNMIPTLKNHFGCNVGYSGHEVGLQISLAAVAMGATSIERHITLGRSMYGSDQSASVEPGGVLKLVRDIKIIEKAMGDGVKIITEKEESVKESLRPLNWR